MHITGYHGTSFVSAKYIKGVHFKLTSSSWLGQGAYLYENDLMRAYTFAQRKHSHVKSAVVRVVVDTANMLDMSDPESQGAQEFVLYKNDFCDATGVNERNVKIDPIALDAHILETLCRDKSYLLVRAATYVDANGIEYGLFPDRTPNVIEICIRENSVVLSKNLMSLEYIV